MLRRAALLLVVTVPLTVLVVASPSAYATSVSVRTAAHTASATAVRTAVLRLPAAATDVAAYWRGAPQARVTLAFSRDGVRFGAPVDAGRDEVGEQRANGITYGAIRPAGGAVAVRVVSDRVLARVSVVGMSDGARTVTRTALPRAAGAAVAQPAVLPRSAWGADESLRFDANGQEKWPPAFHATKKLVVHHTDTPNGETDATTVASRLRSIYHYHAVTQGWGDIGYNFLVDEAGRVYEGRHSRDYAPGAPPSGDDAQGRGVTGAHTSGWNSGTVGIALLGTLTSRDAGPAARSSLEELLAWEAGRNAIDPQGRTAFTNPSSGSTITTYDIAGHRAYIATECPGGTFDATLPQLRAAVAARISGTPSPAPDTAAPSTPTGLTAAGDKRAVTLRWSAASDDVAVTGYRVARATSSGGTYAVLGSTGATSYTSKGLKSGQAYWFRVQAYDAAGNASAWSGAVAATAK